MRAGPEPACDRSGLRGASPATGPPGKHIKASPAGLPVPPPRMPSVLVPHPCAVYTRKVSGEAYTFSHHAQLAAPKIFPSSLRTADLRLHDPRQNWAQMQKACFLVLAAGDVAQCVSIATAREKSRTQFLYHGSSFARKHGAGMGPAPPSEVHEDFVPLHFHSTMAVFDRANRFHAVVPIESGISLFPRQIHAKDVPLLARWVEACMLRSAHASVWVTEQGESYNEHTWEHSPTPKHRGAR